MRHILTQLYHSPCGDLVLGSFDGRLCLCDWAAGDRREFVARRLRRVLRAMMEERASDVVAATARQLDEYFGRRRAEFDIPLMLAGTDFQKTVWRGLAGVAYGSTVPYAAFARRLGMPAAVRAVANANRANAISVIVPCHRVIGSDGSLTGYGGGLGAKRFLLELESSGGAGLWTARTGETPGIAGLDSGCMPEYKG